MATFNESSKAKLNTCHTNLIYLFTEVVKGYDCSIIEGHRSPARQLQLFSEGKSKVKKGKHNHYPSHAVDVAPYPVDWEDLSRFYHFAGYVKRVAEELDVAIRWGGDWDSDGDFKDQTFNDLVHWELIV